VVGVSSIIYFDVRGGLVRGGEIGEVLVVGVVEELLLKVKVGVGHR
jgi:hypothetical protein